MVAKHFGGSNGPCPICGRSFNSSGKKRTQCRELDSGWVICHYEKFVGDRRNGYTCTSVSNIDEGSWRPDGGASPRASRPGPLVASATRPTPKESPRPSRYEETLYALAHAQWDRLQPADVTAVAGHLGLPRPEIERVGRNLGTTTWIGTRKGYWLLADEYGYGRGDRCLPVAVHVRNLADGTDKQSWGHPDAKVKRGFYMVESWDRNPGGPILLVEGLSGMLSVLTLGISCIGRANNSFGAEDLARWFAESGHAAREFVVIADIDRKGGKCPKEGPGWTGALRFAEAFGHVNGKPVRVAFPPGSELPEGPKDSREWFCEQWDRRDDRYQRLAVPYIAGVRASAVVVEPKAPAPKGDPSSRAAEGEEFPFLRDPALMASASASLARSLVRQRAEREAARVAADVARRAEAARLAEEKARAEEQACRALFEALRAEEEAGRLRELELDREFPQRVVERERRAAETRRREEDQAAREIAERRCDFESYGCDFARSAFLDGGGRPFEQICRCESRTRCTGCKVFMIDRDVRHAALRFGQAQRLFEGVVSREEWPGLIQRIRRAGGNYARTAIGDGGGRDYLVADVSVGRLTPVALGDALAEVRGLLEGSESTTRPMHFSHAWRTPQEQFKPETPHRVVIFLPGVIDSGVMREVAEQYGAIAEVKFDCRTPGGPNPRACDILRRTVFRKAGGGGFTPEDSDRLIYAMASRYDLDCDRACYAPRNRRDDSEEAFEAFDFASL